MTLQLDATLVGSSIMVHPFLLRGRKVTKTCDQKDALSLSPEQSDKRLNKVQAEAF